MLADRIAYKHRTRRSQLPGRRGAVQSGFGVFADLYGANACNIGILKAFEFPQAVTFDISLWQLGSRRNSIIIQRTLR
ncbi:hypothetical protein D3C85_1472670 [compost metagenome]